MEKFEIQIVEDDEIIAFTREHSDTDKAVKELDEKLFGKNSSFEMSREKTAYAAVALSVIQSTYNEFDKIRALLHLKKTLNIA